MASPTIEEYEDRLWKMLGDIDREISELLPKLSNVESTEVVDSTSQVSGFKGSQRLGQLMELRSKTVDLLNQIPYMESVPVAMGVDAIGRELGESVLDA